MFLKYWKSIARSSLVGLLTGIIPGAGANVATFVSYGIGERLSGRRFSKGDMEGVVCSEVANNANIGDVENRRLGIRVDCDDKIRILHTHLMLQSSGYPRSNV